MNFKRILLLLIFAEVLSFSSYSNPGDTTWVTVYNLRKITQYGNYDTTAVFPTGKRYRKIRLHYILGRYACAPGSQYCGSWDYTTQIFAKPANADTVEIARVITPYATDWLSQNRKHDYVVEVTDYASILEGSIGMRYNYSGYSWGFTLTLKLEFIEGVPPMDAISAKNLYRGYFPYGNAANSIENYLTAKQFSYTATTGKTFLKNTVSGHGSDAQGCSEFCSKYYQLKLNNTNISQKQLWRNDCGINEVYPQTGTWVFDRGNWCPGAVVWPIYHDLSHLTTANSTFTLDVDMEPYTISSPSGGYEFQTQLVQYTAPNHSLDVSIEDIVSPSKNENYYRENPVCMNPVIKFKNVGTDTVKKVVFNYGLKGGTVMTHTWTGSLAFLEELTEVFPPSTNLLTGTTSAVFEVSLVSVNGTNDQNTFNNTYQSQTTPVAIYPKDFIVKMFTNKGTDTITGFNETRWKLEDQNGLIIAQRVNLTNNTVYLDTIRNLNPGCYKMTIDDAGCDGYTWWFYPNYPVNPGNGGLRFDYINANNTIANFQGDFGCNYTSYFYVKASPPTNLVGINTENLLPNTIELSPNPSSDRVYVKLDLNQKQNIELKLMDIGGRVILQKTINNVMAAYETLDVQELNSGVYFVSIQLEDGSVMTKKLIVN